MKKSPVITLSDLIAEVEDFKAQTRAQLYEKERVREMEEAAHARHRWASEVLGVPLDEIPMSLLYDPAIQIQLATLQGCRPGEAEMLRGAIAAAARQRANYEAEQRKVKYTVIRGLSHDGRTLGWRIVCDDKSKTTRERAKAPRLCDVAGTMVAKDWAGIEVSSTVDGFSSDDEAHETLSLKNRPAIEGSLFATSREQYTRREQDVAEALLDPLRTHPCAATIKMRTQRQSR